jgi:hypothetical protein
MRVVKGDVQGRKGRVGREEIRRIQKRKMSQGFLEH